MHMLSHLPCNPRRRSLRSGTLKTCPDIRSRVYRCGVEVEVRGGSGWAGPLLNSCFQSLWLQEETNGGKSGTFSETEIKHQTHQMLVQMNLGDLAFVANWAWCINTESGDKFVCVEIIKLSPTGRLVGLQTADCILHICIPSSKEHPRTRGATRLD